MSCPKPLVFVLIVVMLLHSRLELLVVDDGGAGTEAILFKILNLKE
jgi:hypothetical protein